MEENKKSVYEQALAFKQKYRTTIAWRLKKNSKIIEKHLNPGEEVLYVFCAQKNNHPLGILETAVVALTSERILIGRDRVVIGYFMDSITPDLFNDLKVRSGIIWGKIDIDTVKEFVTFSNIAKAALSEIETKITSIICKKKRSIATSL